MLIFKFLDSKLEDNSAPEDSKHCLTAVFSISNFKVWHPRFVLITVYKEWIK